MRPFKIHTPENSDPQASVVLSNTRDHLGLIPNVMAVIAASVPALNAFTKLNESFGASSFTATEKEVIQFTASIKNVVAYCVAGHTSFAKKQNVPDDIVAALRNGESLEDPRLEALAEFTRKLMRTTGNITQSDLIHFFDAGFTQANIMEVILGICVKVFSNYVSSATNIPLDDAFAPYAWTPHDDKADYIRLQDSITGLNPLYG